MKKTNWFICLMFWAMTVSVASAQEAEQQKTLMLSYEHEGELYPPVFFVTNIDDPTFTSALEEFSAFEKLDDKAVGLPIGLRILKGHRTKSDGTQFSTLMLSASTLGLIPVVSNTEFKVRYDVFVQGKSILHFEYSMDSTDVDSMWTMNYNDRKEKPSESLFMKDTLPQFFNDLQKSEIAQETFEEYNFYFQRDD